MCQFFNEHNYPMSAIQADHHCNQQIDWQLTQQMAQKENTDCIPFTFTFHPHNHTVKSIILKTWNYLEMIQRLVLSFSNLH